MEGNLVDTNEAAFTKFIVGLRRLLSLEREGGLGVRILLEFDEPE